MSNIQEQIERYEKLESKVESLKNDVQRESIELEYDKSRLKEKMDELNSKGISFSNLTELEEELEKLSVEFESILSSTERKLSEFN